MSEYIFPLLTFPNQVADLPKLMTEIRSSAITKALDYVDKNISECLINFKADLEPSELTTLSGVVLAHDGVPVKIEPPRMADGRPLVRSDTRPLDTATYFSSCGDSPTEIGGGQDLMWDFGPGSEYTTISGPTTLSDGHQIEEGFKAQVIDISFVDDVYFKDGALYFFDAPWKCNAKMTIVVPAGNYYPNKTGPIPASALGLPGNGKYSYAATDTQYYSYVNKHFMYGNCPMGDELNAEGAQINALPPSWMVRCVITTPISDDKSKGFASFEIYRNRTTVMEGDTI